MVTVLVTGGRNYNDKTKLYSVLDQMHDVGGPPYHMEITEIVNDGLSGASKLSADWAREHKKHNGTSIRLYQFFADGPGPTNISDMIEARKPEVCVLFTPNDLTSHSTQVKAQQAKIPVVVID